MLGKYVIVPFFSINYIFSENYIFLLNFTYNFAIITCLVFLVLSEQQYLIVLFCIVVAGCDTSTEQRGGLGTASIINQRCAATCSAECGESALSRIDLSNRGQVSSASLEMLFIPYKLDFFEHNGAINK